MEKEEDKNKALSQELLEALIKESELLDDHGSLIVGERTKKAEKM